MRVIFNEEHRVENMRDRLLVSVFNYWAGRGLNTIAIEHTTKTVWALYQLTRYLRCSNFTFTSYVVNEIVANVEDSEGNTELVLIASIRSIDTIGQVFDKVVLYGPEDKVYECMKELDNMGQVTFDRELENARSK